MSKHKSPVAPGPKPATIGWYDARRGAAGYSPIIGTFGALSIPAIFLLFNQDVVVKEGPTFTVFAIGMLIVSLLGTMFGAIGLAAIAAETEPTANIAPAIMSISVSISVGLATLFAGIAVVANEFVPEADWLFLALVAITGMAGAFLTAAAIPDSVGLGPEKGSPLWAVYPWIDSGEKAVRHFLIAASVAAVIDAGALTVRLSTRASVPLSVAFVSWVIVGSVGLVLTGMVYAVIRTAHDTKGMQTGLRRAEAYVTTIVGAGYAAFILFILP